MNCSQPTIELKHHASHTWKISVYSTSLMSRTIHDCLLSSHWQHFSTCPHVRLVAVLFAYITYMSSVNKVNSCCYWKLLGLCKLEYLAVYGRSFMGVPVGALLSGTRKFSNGTVLDGHVRAWQTVIGRRLGLRHKIFVTDRNVTTWVVSRSVREAQLKLEPLALPLAGVFVSSCF